MERMGLRAGANTSVNEQVGRPVEPVLNWIKAGDVTSGDLDVISGMYRNTEKGAKQLAQTPNFDDMLEKFRLSGYAEGLIGGRTKLELRGMGLKPDKGAAFMKVSITLGSGESIMREEIDKYFAGKGIELFRIAKTR
jgi:hypothetical protein